MPEGHEVILASLDGEAGGGLDADVAPLPPPAGGVGEARTEPDDDGLAHATPAGEARDEPEVDRVALAPPAGEASDGGATQVCPDQVHLPGGLAQPPFIAVGHQRFAGGSPRGTAMAFRPQMGGIGAMSGGMGGTGGGSGMGSMMAGTRPNAQLAQQLLMQNLIASDPALAADIGATNDTAGISSAPAGCAHREECRRFFRLRGLRCTCPQQCPLE